VGRDLLEGKVEREREREERPVYAEKAVGGRTDLESSS
jgi:hypothetical protein